MFLEVDEPGFDPLDRIELLRIGRLQLGRYLLDLCGGNFPEVSIGTVTENGLRSQILRLQSVQVGTHLTNG